MEKLLMCRICLCNDIPLRSLVDTHLQKIYEALTMTPLVAEDSRPSLACDLCCSRLETCYELRRQSLSSEKLFTQLLRCKVQVTLQIMFNKQTSMEDVMQMTADVLDNGVVKQVNAEDVARDDSVACSDSEDDTAMWDVLETAPEVDDVAPSFEENSFREENYVQSSDSEDVISPAVVKEEQSDVTANAARDDSGASSGSEDDTAMWDVLQTALELDDVAPSFEENSFREEDYLQSSDLESEDVISPAVVKEEQSDVTASAPQLTAQKYRNDTLLNSLNKTDHTMDKVEEREGDTRRDIEDATVEKNKIVATGGYIDIRLYNDKQNNSTSDHNYARKEICENKISADQSVNSSSSDKLTPWSCDTCQKCFASEGDLITHSSTHTGEDVTLLCFECNLCKKWFSRRRSLVQHFRTHMDKKHFECNVCKKCFRYKASLNRHMRIHTGEKRYECNMCKKRFIQKGNLNSHMRIHTGEKPYECNVCKKRFIEKSKLTNHTRMHTGDKPYKCNVCKKCFTFKQSLDRHRRTQVRNCYSVYDMSETVQCKE